MSKNPEHDDWVLPDGPPLAERRGYLMHTTGDPDADADVLISAILQDSTEPAAGPAGLTFRRKVAVAVTVATVAAVGLFVVPLAGAGTPWYCHLGPPTGAVCHAVAIGNDSGKVVNHTANAVENTANATVSAAGLLDKGTGAIAKGLDWANQQAANLPRVLQPGECITTSTGTRWCLPVAAATSAPAPAAVPAMPTSTVAAPAVPAGAPAGAIAVVPVGACVVDSAGRKWCVTR